MHQVTLLFPSWLSFRLWCKAMDILRDGESANTLHHDGRFLGHYFQAPDTFDGILAQITIENRGGVPANESNPSHVPGG
jgi:hypothetical protein